VGLLGLAAIAAAALLMGRISGFRSVGEEGARVWFYDQSEQRLYETPRDTVPPHKGIGGTGGDGVRAVVFAFRGQENDAAKRRIAYLETNAPELKAIFEKLRVARTEKRPYQGPMPSRDSDFFQTNTLVRLVDEPAWHPLGSPEGRRITTDWQGLRSPDGRPPVICLP